MSSAALFVGSQVPGTVKSFVIKQGWGFVQSTIFPEDVFVSIKSSPGLEQTVSQFGKIDNMPVTFTVKESEKNPGSFEGVNVCIGGNAADFVGREIQGVFKSFVVKSGWGFLNTPYFPGDIFVSLKTAPELEAVVGSLGRLEGQHATFTVRHSTNTLGAYEASDVRLSADGVVQAIFSPLRGSLGSAAAPVKRGLDPSALVGKRCFGSFKSWVAHKGYGFLTARGVNGDVFVSFKTDPNLQATIGALKNLNGMTCSFELVESTTRPGQYQAQDVSLKAALPAKAARPAKAEIEEYQSTITDWSSLTDWSSSSVTDWSSLTDWSSIADNQSSPLFAALAAAARQQTAPASAAQSQEAADPFALVGQWVPGSIKSFHFKNGWGFLQCPHLTEDVFVSLKTAPDLQAIVARSTPGGLDNQPVTFLLQYSQAGHGTFEAGGVRLAGPGKSGKGSYGPAARISKPASFAGPYAAMWQW